MDDDSETALRCEMVNQHHSDCECQVCKAHTDAVCDKPAVGFLQQGEQLCRVCDKHAKIAAEDPEAYGVLTYYKKFRAH